MELSNLELDLDKIIFMLNTSDKDYKNNILSEHLETINKHDKLILENILTTKIQVNDLSEIYLELILNKIIILFSFVTYSEIVLSIFLLFALLYLHSNKKIKFNLSTQSIVDSISSENTLNQLNLMINLLNINKDLKKKIKTDIYKYIYALKI